MRKNKADTKNNIETINNKKSKKPFYKKWWSWLIAIIIICSCCSCASGNSDDDSEEEDVAISEDTETNGEEESNGDKDSSDNEEDSNDDTEIVVVDNDEYAITLTGIDSDNEKGYALTFYLDNNSSADTYIFFMPYAELNGVDINPDYDTPAMVSPKQDTEYTIVFPDSELNKAGISEVSEIGLQIFTSTDSGENAALDIYYIYPNGKNENIESIKYEGSDTDYIFLDGEYIKASVTGIEEQDDGYVIDMYLENPTDSTISVKIQGYIDEDTTETFWDYVLLPETWGLTSVEVSEATLSEIGITDFNSGIVNINLNMRVSDYPDYGSSAYVDWDFTLSSFGFPGYGNISSFSHSLDGIYNNSDNNIELAIVDNDECVITLTGIDSDNEEGYAMTFYFENKSSEYSDIIPSAEINGVGINAEFSVSLEDGRGEGTLIFPKDELERAGINEISEIGLYIWVYDKDTGFTAGTVVQEIHYFYPDGEETAETLEYEGADSDNVLLDNGNIKASVTGIEEQDDGYVVNMYLKNKTDSLMFITVLDGSEQLWYYFLMPGAWTLTSVEISESTLSEIGVNDFSSGIENIDFSFGAINVNGYGFVYTSFTLRSLIGESEEVEDSSDEETEEDTTNTESEGTDEEAEEDTTNTESEGTSEITLGMSNALKSAKKYLSYSAFSYTGIIEQLEYEGYSTEEATYAADNCGADWYEQAAAKAESYLEYSAFSYTGLIEQLEYEGFSTEEATYAVDNCGADWDEQAVAKAESYLEYTSFSRSELINQLEFEGFTSEQAEYAADAVGY